MKMAVKKKQQQDPPRKVTTLITSDMVIDLYLKAKTKKGKEKDELMKRVVFLSEHLNHYTPIIPDLYR